MKIAIIGTGYVGLITGLSLVQLGHKVICVDNDAKKVLMINSGKAPFYEPGLGKQLKTAINKKQLYATEDLQGAVLTSDVIFIAVGTPTINNRIDLTAIKQVSQELGKILKKSRNYQVVAVKSTVLPGVTEGVIKTILEKYSGKKAGEFGLCMNPEFLREGSALEDALHPDRIIIGQYDAKSGRELGRVYKKVSCPVLFANLKTAELTKYASNALFATLISYSNEIARISEAAGGIDVLDVWEGVHLDRRLSPKIGSARIRPGVLNYILSGCGYGGSCFPKDTKALAAFSKTLGVDPLVINSVISINKTQPHRLIMLLKKALGPNLKNKKIVVLGLAFKPETDDTRESPAFPVIEELLVAGAKVVCHDPKVSRKIAPAELTKLPVVFAPSPMVAVKNADAAIVITAWKEYKKLLPRFFKQNMKRPVVVDGRRIYNKAAFLNEGIIYKGIGL